MIGYEEYIGGEKEAIIVRCEGFRNPVEPREWRGIKISTLTREKVVID